MPGIIFFVIQPDLLANFILKIGAAFGFNLCIIFCSKANIKYFRSTRIAHRPPGHSYLTNISSCLFSIYKKEQLSDKINDQR